MRGTRRPRSDSQSFLFLSSLPRFFSPPRGRANQPSQLGPSPRLRAPHVGYTQHDTSKSYRPAPRPAHGEGPGHAPDRMTSGRHVMAMAWGRVVGVVVFFFHKAMLEICDDVTCLVFWTSCFIVGIVFCAWDTTRKKML